MRLESVRELKQSLRGGAAPHDAPGGDMYTLIEGAPQAVPDAGPTIALGAAPTGRRGDYKLAIMVQREDLMGSREVEHMLAVAAGEALVEYIGPGFKHAAGFTGGVRPLKPGYSVGHPDVPAGTLGCFVDTPAGVRILSNNHVLADENKGKRGDDILQPGTYDGGTAPGDVVGQLDDFEPLSFTRSNRMDAAIATLAEGIDFDPAVPGMASIAGVVDVDDTVPVVKVGRTTGLTRGRVVRIEADTVLGYDGGAVRFDGVIHVEGERGSFGDFGDSGALVLTDEERPQAIGLYFAGLKTGRGVVAPLPPTLERFEATLVR